MSIKDLAQTIVAVGGAAAVIGGVVYSAGWVVSEKAANAYADETSQQKANAVTEQLYVLSRSAEEAQLNADIQNLMMLIQLMESKPRRTDFENTQISVMKGQVGQKQSRLAEIAAEKLKVKEIK